MKQAMKAALQAEESRAPTFDDSWSAAKARYGASKRRYRVVASAAAVLAVAALVIVAQTPQPPLDMPLVSEDDLLWRTSWAAPSDAWLPDHEFDIYQDLPTLTEST